MASAIWVQPQGAQQAEQPVAQRRQRLRGVADAHLAGILAPGHIAHGWTRFSIVQWPRHSASTWAAEAARGGRLVTP